MLRCLQASCFSSDPVIKSSVPITERHLSVDGARRTVFVYIPYIGLHMTHFRPITACHKLVSDSRHRRHLVRVLNPIITAWRPTSLPCLSVCQQQLKLYIQPLRGRSQSVVNIRPMVVSRFMSTWIYSRSWRQVKSILLIYPQDFATSVRRFYYKSTRDFPTFKKKCLLRSPLGPI